MTYSNRYESINRVVYAVGQLGCKTATEVSKHVNLSRQNILDVLKHAKSWGYVTEEKQLYRAQTDKCQAVYRSVWTVTPYGNEHSSWFVNAMKKYENGKGMKPLL